MGGGSLKKLIYYFIAIIFAIPLILEHLVFRNKLYSPISNEAWSSFLGSYIGGIIGGIGTLLAVYFTINQTIKIQKENTIMQNKNRKIEFINNVSDITAEFITDINKYFYACCRDYRIGMRLVNEKDANKINDLKEELKNNLVDRTIAIKCYYLLHIKLKEFDSANEFLEMIEKIHNGASSPINFKNEYFMDNNTKELMKILQDFSNKYLEEK